MGEMERSKQTMWGWREYTKGVWMLGIYRERGGRQMVYGCEAFKKDGESRQYNEWEMIIYVRCSRDRKNKKTVIKPMGIPVEMANGLNK